jgi:hypothetical protein
MNIFFIDNNPRLAATYLCDQHVVKMLLESAQLLSTLAREKCDVIECDTLRLYKSTHKNHPCALWLKEHPHNWGWLWHHVCGIEKEYHERYNKSHKSMSIAWNAAGLLQNAYDLDEVNWESFTTPPQCMPSRYKVEGAYVTAYRRYYVGEKIPKFATWKRGTPQPEWTLDQKYVVPQVKLTLCPKVS